MNPPVDAPASSARRPSASTANRVEGGVELLSAPADERRRRAQHDDGLVGRTSRAGLSAWAPRHEHPAGADRRLGLVPVGDQAAADQLGVEPPAGPGAQLLDPGVSGASWRGVSAGGLLGRGGLLGAAFFGRGRLWAAALLGGAFAAFLGGPVLAAFFGRGAFSAGARSPWRPGCHLPLPGRRRPPWRPGPPRPSLEEVRHLPGQSPPTRWRRSS